MGKNPNPFRKVESTKLKYIYIYKYVYRKYRIVLVLKRSELTFTVNSNSLERKYVFVQVLSRSFYSKRSPKTVISSSICHSLDNVLTCSIQKIDATRLYFQFLELVNCYFMLTYAAHYQSLLSLCEL
jgi:hypothetical protein